MTRYIVKKGPKIPTRGSGGGQKIETWVVWDTVENGPITSESTVKSFVETLCKNWNDYHSKNETKLGKVLK